MLAFRQGGRVNRKSPQTPYIRHRAVLERNRLAHIAYAAECGDSATDLPGVSIATLSTTFVPLFARPVLAAPLTPRTQLLAGGGDVAGWLGLALSMNCPPGGARNSQGDRDVREWSPVLALEKRVEAPVCLPVCDAVLRGVPETRGASFGASRRSRADVSESRLPLDGRSNATDLARETLTAVAAARPERALELSSNVARTTGAHGAVHVRISGFAHNRGSRGIGVRRVTAWSLWGRCVGSVHYARGSRVAVTASCRAGSRGDRWTDAAARQINFSRES